MTGPAVELDRRQRRRRETIEEVLEVALEVMAESGVAGLSLGEVARRMGIRPPSLYVYFPSKNALYDALFARGARCLVETARGSEPEEGQTLEQVLLDHARVFVRWAVEHPTYSQLLFWRPVPGFEPSGEAYAPAVELVDEGRRHFADLQRRGLLRDDVPLDELFRDWTIVISGVVSQQLANAPDEPWDAGSFTSRLPAVVAMFARHSTPPTPARRTRARSR